MPKILLAIPSACIYRNQKLFAAANLHLVSADNVQGIWRHSIDLFDAEGTGNTCNFRMVRKAKKDTKLATQNYLNKTLFNKPFES